MKSLDIVSITNTFLVLAKVEVVLVMVFVPLRIVMKYSMRRETPNLRIEGIHNMNITTELSIKSSVFGTHQDTDFKI